MAFRRRLGNLADMLLKQQIAQENAQKESELVADRQMELARYNRGSIEQQAELTRKEGERNDFRAHPEVALRSLQSGNSSAEPFVLGGRESLDPAFDAIGKAKEFNELPSMMAAFGMRKPGIIKDLTPIAELQAAHDAQAGQIANSNASEVDQAGAKAQSEAYGTGMGQEESTNANFGAELGRKKRIGQQDNTLALDRARGMIPINVSEAGQSAEATRAGTLRADAADPSWDATALQAINNPDMLTTLTPGDAGKVIRRAAQLGLEQPNLKQRSSEEMISSAERALDTLRSRGNINAAFGQPSPLDPGSMMRWIPWVGGNAAGSAAESTSAMAGQLVATLTLPRLSMMKGFGHLSDNDMKVLQTSTTILANPNIADKEAHYALDQIDSTLALARSRAGLPPRTPATSTGTSSGTRSILSRPRR